jgi:hypothetical protein
MGSLIMHPSGTVLTLLEPGLGSLPGRVTPRRIDLEILATCHICHQRHTRRRPVGVECERCRQQMHWACWERLATPAERHTLMKTEDPFSFFCRRCLS